MMFGFARAVVFAQEGSPEVGGPMAIVLSIVYLLLILAWIAGLWKTFEKAGKPGWAAIVPIYNVFVLVEISGKPNWWALLCFVPCVNFIVLILILIDVAKNFGKGPGFGIGLALLSFIFFPLLGFGDAKYRKVTE